MSAVPLSQRNPARPADRADMTDGAAVPSSPPANRARRSRWRDPRLWMGALLVLASVVIGARVLAAADDTVPVWTLDHAVSAGMAITNADVGVTRVHFSTATDQSRYWLADQALPAQAHLTRDVGAGEMLARSAVSTDTSAVPHELPLGVPAAGLPSDIAPGDHVEVWAVPQPDHAKRPPERVLSDVAVLSVGDVSVTGVGSDRQVVVGLPDGADTSAVLDSLNGSSVVLVRIGG